MAHTADFINALTSPDRRYGEVPFYWWNGSPLEKDRLSEQIRMLAEKGLAGVQVNYAHINGGGEDNVPHGGHGKSIPGTPEQFSEEWWEFFSFAAKECEKYGMSIGMGDYTIAWIGNGYFTDKVASLPDMHAKNLSCEKKMLFSGDESSFTDDVLFVLTYEDMQCEKPVMIYEKDKGIISPIKGICEGYIISILEKDNSINPLDERCGNTLVEIYFKEFERRCPDVKPGTLNYFFQDELMFGTDIKTLWSDSLRDGIKEKYGYDIAGFIPHLFYSLGNITPKIRLDTADVKTEIAEKCYFRPIYEYHSSRGLIYGCDQSGRGKAPSEFGDYFRTVRWFTAPGNDTPGRAADLIKVKVNSSIAHLYERPRVWLEGYHSSGWGTTLESITAPTGDNFIFGANLLNLHGLYYSTNGGFFEWAPPDFHFRMPYWDDEKYWLDKYKRMSALLCLGQHFCDAAIYYPVSSCDYGENSESCINETFSVAEFLFKNGLDFDFIDFQSVENATCSNGRLITQTESYKVLIFAGVDCIRYSAVKKAKELLKTGGTVVFCGITPYASDRKGLNDSVLKQDISDILSHPNAVLAASHTDVLTFINTKITRSFFPDEEEKTDKVYVHGRKHGNDKLFFVRYAKKDSVCRFETGGTPYLLDTYKGEIIKLEGTVSAGDFTFIKMPLDGDSDTLILFTDNEPDYERVINTSGFSREILKNDIELSDEWDISFIPTLDNTYGDYYLPKGGTIGIQARFFDIAKVKNDKEIPEYFEYKQVPYCTSDSFRSIVCDKNCDELLTYLSSTPEAIRTPTFIYEDREYSWETRPYNLRYSYISDNFDTSLYEQGHHGLKGRITNDNIYFSAPCIYQTYVYSPEDMSAELIIGSIKPERVLVNSTDVSEGKISLKKGKNLILAAFSYNKEAAPDYKNRSEIKRTSLHIVKDTVKNSEYPLCSDFFADDNTLPFSDNSDDSDIFCFRFRSAHGMTSMKINTFGKLISAFNDGKLMDITYIGNGNFNGNMYNACANNVSQAVSEVLFYIKTENKDEYASLIPEPIELNCVGGKEKPGDLCLTGALRNFSGKTVYEKDIVLEKLYPDERFILDLPDAASTAKVEINGKTAAVFTFRPFTEDITDFIENGINHIKITVSNTLCNHYSTVPSRYSNFPRDAAWGLISAPHIRIYEKE
ncbi:MAG: hypothetical protein IKL47_05215 [Clostridia bacterium]|nr:hypothetical protein [Clostridia bacterium]